MQIKKSVLAITLLSAVVTLAGCGKSKALTAAEEYEKAACACKDVACAGEASKAFAARASDMSTASSGDAEAIGKATMAATSCLAKVAASSVPTMPAH